MTGAMVFTVRVLPLHNTTHVRTSCGDSDNLPLVWITAIAIIAYDIANNRVCDKAHGFISQVSKRSHKVPRGGNASRYELT